MSNALVAAILVATEPNLQNAWFNECALRYPSGDDRLLDRMRFAPWKITQFYYVIYSGLSGMVRLVNSKRPLPHVTTLNFFVSAIVSDEKLRTKFFPIPLGLTLSGTTLLPDTDHVKLPSPEEHYRSKIQECLERTRNGLSMSGQIGLVHYFRWLREWANYYSSYIFANFYGPIIREKVDRSLTVIANSFMLVAERFAVGFLGRDEFMSIYDNFRKMLVKCLDFEPQFLDERIGLYSSLPEQ